MRICCVRTISRSRGNFLKYNNLHLFVGKQMRDAAAVVCVCVCIPMSVRDDDEQQTFLIDPD